MINQGTVILEATSYDIFQHVRRTPNDTNSR